MSVFLLLETRCLDPRGHKLAIEPEGLSSPIPATSLGPDVENWDYGHIVNHALSTRGTIWKKNVRGQ